jgi:beta-lactamase superfamily II metal-dependent hydrolase
MNKKKKKKSPKKPAATKANSVRVRMYDVGFGDGFVIFFPDGTRTRTLLLDCGSIASGALGSIETVANRMVDDIELETGSRRIDVVVASHRHRDHVSGFAAEVWKNVAVGEVWLPWTEDPADVDATRIREKQAGLAAAMTAASDRGQLSAAATQIALNALSNAAAMDTLHRGFKSRELAEPRYLPEKERSKATFRSKNLPNVTVRVLGPSRLESVIKNMDPPSGESYFAAAARTNGKPGDREPSPFDSQFERSRSAYEAARAIGLDKKLEDRLDRMGTLDDIELAASLESSVNGTSLMLILDLGNVRLLLPGDAQWGTWEAALADPEWGPLFKDANFYKVGHHGSHNATPKRFVTQSMKDSIPAMASVTSVAQWESIPLPALLDGMKKTKHAAVARSDRPTEASATKFKRAADDAWIETWLKV